MVHIAALAELTIMSIHPFCQAQVVSLTSEETGIPTEYFDFSNIFSLNSLANVPEPTGINDHFINLLDNKQPSYYSIYSLGPVELEILKTYIEVKLVVSLSLPSLLSVLRYYLFKKKTIGST